MLRLNTDVFPQRRSVRSLVPPPPKNWHAKRHQRARKRSNEAREGGKKKRLTDGQEGHSDKQAGKEGGLAAVWHPAGGREGNAMQDNPKHPSNVDDRPHAEKELGTRKHEKWGTRRAAHEMKWKPVRGLRNILIQCE